MDKAITPMEIMPSINIPIIVEQYNCKILWKKLHALKLEDELNMQKHTQQKCDNTFETMASTFFFCFMPTGIPSKF